MLCDSMLSYDIDIILGFHVLILWIWIVIEKYISNLG